MLKSYPIEFWRPTHLADGPKLNLLHRYETRLHVMYQRSLHNLLVLRQLGVRNEPNNSPVFNENPEIEHTDDSAPKTPVFTRKKPVRRTHRLSPQAPQPSDVADVGPPKVA